MLSVGISTPAYACPLCNGVKLNGTELNGWKVNGVQFNGLQFNGSDKNVAGQIFAVMLPG